METKQINLDMVDQHVGRRIQLRRNMLGMSQRDLASRCGVTMQQIQKYEVAGNRISVSRMFAISSALETPVSFFFAGLPGNLLPEPGTRKFTRVASPGAVANDLLSRNESLLLINLYWKLPTDEQRATVLKLLKSLNGVIV